MPTTYFAHWADLLNLTIDDASGKADKTGGTGGSFDASARVEQMFEGNYDMLIEATIAVLGNMAIGVYAHSTAYTPGAVTIASLLGCWEVNGSDLLVKESNTLRYTGTGLAVVGAQVKIELLATGDMKFYEKPPAGSYTLRFDSSITAATVKGWRPWRAITTHSASNSKWDPVTITGESAEYYDPDTAANHAVHPDDMYHLDYAVAAPTYEVHVPESGGTVVAEDPFVRVGVM